MLTTFIYICVEMTFSSTNTRVPETDAIGRERNCSCSISGYYQWVSVVLLAGKHNQQQTDKTERPEPW